MEAAAVQKVTRKIEREFPELKGSRPSVKQQGGGKGDPQYLLVYKGKVNLPGGKNMDRVVRVVATADGKVLRMSTSR